jgi:hypothetical protein
MTYTILSMMLVKTKEKGTGREVDKKLHVAIVAY